MASSSSPRLEPWGLGAASAPHTSRPGPEPVACKSGLWPGAGRAEESQKGGSRVCQPPAAQGPPPGRPTLPMCIEHCSFRKALDEQMFYLAVTPKPWSLGPHHSHHLCVCSVGSPLCDPMNCNLPGSCTAPGTY